MDFRALSERMWGSNETNEIPGSFPEPQSDTSIDKFRKKLLIWMQLMLLKPIEFVYKNVIIMVIKSNQLWNSHHSEILVNPADKARSFIREFEESHNIRNNVEEEEIEGDETVGKLPFIENGYVNALYLVKKHCKFLMVYVQSDEHDDSKRFVEKVLFDPELVQIAQRDDVVLWGGNVRQSETYQVANALQATKYPFLAVLCLTRSTMQAPNGVVNTAPQVSVIARIQGYDDPVKIVAKIKSRIAKYEPMLVGIKADKQEEELSRLIKRQQDDAYERSLAADRDRQQSRLAELERQRQERFDEERIRLELQREETMRKQWLLYKKSLLNIPSDNETEQTARIAVRMIDGARIQLRFYKESKIEDIYVRADLMMNNLENEEFDGQNIESLQNFYYRFKFSLISPMNRRKLDDLSKLVGDDNSIWPNGILNMELSGE